MYRVKILVVDNYGSGHHTLLVPDPEADMVNLCGRLAQLARARIPGISQDATIGIAGIEEVMPPWKLIRVCTYNFNEFVCVALQLQHSACDGTVLVAGLDLVLDQAIAKAVEQACHHINRHDIQIDFHDQGSADGRHRRFFVNGAEASLVSRWFSVADANFDVHVARALEAVNNYLLDEDNAEVAIKRVDEPTYDTAVDLLAAQEAVRAADEAIKKVETPRLLAQQLRIAELEDQLGQIDAAVPAVDFEATLLQRVKIACMQEKAAARVLREIARIVLCNDIDDRLIARVCQVAGERDRYNVQVRELQQRLDASDE